MVGESRVRWPGQRMMVTKDIELMATWTDATIIAFPAFRTVSLVLSGRIGVNFFADLTMLTEEEREECYVTFTVNGKSQDASYDVNNTDAKTGKYHGFTCYVSSIQMAEAIKATLHYGGERTVSMNYSVEDYVKYVDEHQSYFTERTIALVKAIADYGHYAQPFLSKQNGWTIGKDYAEMKTYYTDSYDADAIKASLAEYMPVKAIGGTKVGGTSLSLRLDAGTRLEVFLKPAEGQTLSVDDVTASFAANGKDPTITMRSDGRLSVCVDNVSAHQLGVPLIIKSGGKEILRASALSYAYIAFGSLPESTPIMCALYQYHADTLALRG